MYCCLLWLVMFALNVMLGWLGVLDLVALRVCWLLCLFTGMGLCGWLGYV